MNLKGRLKGIYRNWRRFIGIYEDLKTFNGIWMYSKEFQRICTHLKWMIGITRDVGGFKRGILRDKERGI